MILEASGRIITSGDIKKIENPDDKGSVDGRATYEIGKKFEIHAPNPVNIKVKGTKGSNNFKNVTEFSDKDLFEKGTSYVRIYGKKRPIFILNGGLIAKAKKISSNEDYSLFKVESPLKLIDVVSID